MSKVPNSPVVGKCPRCNEWVRVYATSRYFGRCVHCHKGGIVKVRNTEFKINK